MQGLVEKVIQQIWAFGNTEILDLLDSIDQLRERALRVASQVSPFTRVNSPRNMVPVADQHISGPKGRGQRPKATTSKAEGATGKREVERGKTLGAPEGGPAPRPMTP